MSFLVRVAVLPVQISLMKPRDSGASIFLTNKLSFFIMSTEKAIEILTAKGSPSGTATITIVIPMVKYSKMVKSVSVSKRPLLVKSTLKTRKIVMERKIRKPATYPHFPMSAANFSSFS